MTRTSTLLYLMVGQRQERMEHDETTPPCKLCGGEHVGTFKNAYLMLRGNYTFNPALGAEVFVIDSDCAAEFFVMPNGMKAVVVDVREKLPATAVVHEECMKAAITTMGYYGVELEQEVDDDLMGDDEDDEDDDG